MIRKRSVVSVKALLIDSFKVQSTRTIVVVKGRLGHRDDQSKGTIKLQVKG
jgi:hypothetical protein